MQRLFRRSGCRYAWPPFCYSAHSASTGSRGQAGDAGRAAEARQAFIEHQSELKQRDALNLEWTQLQLEQATWATQARIETTARERLGMIRPGPDRVIYVGGGAWAR